MKSARSGLLPMPRVGARQPPRCCESYEGQSMKLSIADRPVMSKLAAICAIGTIAAGVWTMLASVVFLLGTGLLQRFSMPFYQWWLYLPYAGQNSTVKLWLEISGGGATLFLLGLAAIRVVNRPNGPSLRTSLFQSRPQSVMRGTTDNHGHADWLA